MLTVYYAVIRPETFAKKCTEKMVFPYVFYYCKDDFQVIHLYRKEPTKKITYLFHKKKVGIIFVK